MNGIVDGIRSSIVCTGDQSTSERDDIVSRINNLNSEVVDCGTRNCNPDTATDSEKIDAILTAVDQILMGVVLILERFHIPYQV